MFYLLTIVILIFSLKAEFKKKSFKYGNIDGWEKLSVDRLDMLLFVRHSGEIPTRLVLLWRDHRGRQTTGGRFETTWNSTCSYRAGKLYAWSSTIQLCTALLRITDSFRSKKYPKGLGKTVADLDISHAALNLEKTKFSMFNQEIHDFLESKSIKTVVIFGLEVR